MIIKGEVPLCHFNTSRIELIDTVDQGRFGTVADSGSGVLAKEKRLELNVQELIPDTRQETGTGARQLGICETPVGDGNIHITNAWILEFSPSACGGLATPGLYFTKLFEGSHFIIVFYCPS